jgi:hypothetical protein
MKNCLYKFGIASLVLTSTSYAQTWKPVDLKRTITEPKIAATTDGSVFIAGYIHGKTSSVVLWKYDGKSIQKVYEPGFVKQNPDVSIAVDPNNTPYLAYKEDNIGMVKRWDGQKLVDVGSGSPAPKSPNYFRMVLDRTGVPYAFYLSDGFFYIKKLKDGQWEQLLETRQAGDYKTAFNSKNELLITFKQKHVVQKLVDGALVNIGPAYAAMKNDMFNLAVSNTDEIYITYGKFEDGVLKIAKLEGGKEWKALADPTADIKGQGELPVLAFDNKNTLFFACSFRSSSTNIVRKLEGDKWVPAQSGIDEEDLKLYGGSKQFSFSASTNTLYMSRPFYVTKP